MAAKCNITSSVLKKLNKLYWGFSSEYIEDKILENYIEYLACPTIKLVICNNDDCTNPTTIIDCAIQVTGMIFVVDNDNNTITFSIPEESIVGSTPPITYTWQFDSTKLESVNGVNNPTLILTPKGDRTIDTLSISIILTIVDAIGCKYTKTCYLANSGISCGNFVLCVNPKNLVVTNQSVNCVSPKHLVIYSGIEGDIGDK